MKDKKTTNDDISLANGASMEDILSSIRQAINEENISQNTSQAPQQAVPEEDILELKEPVKQPPQPSTLKQHWEKHSYHQPQALEKPILDVEDAEDTILSEEAEVRTRKALSSLSAEIQKQQKSEAEQAYFAIEWMLRPILIEWCNKHLPDIVTRSVQKEIQALVKTLTQKRNG